MEDKAADAVELRRLAGLATRPTVASAIAELAALIEAELPSEMAGASGAIENSKPGTSDDTPAAAVPVSVPAPVITSKASVSPVARSKKYTKISSYGWDQTEANVKIYVALPDVESIEPNLVTFSATEEAFTLTVDGLGGKNYTLIATTSKALDPAKCIRKIRKGRLILVLKKKETGTWSYLTESEQRAADAKAPKPSKGGDAADPQASIMDMMKNMYDSGDDDMKRMIGKAWTEGQDKKGAGQL